MVSTPGRNTMNKGQCHRYRPYERAPTQRSRWVDKGIASMDPGVTTAPMTAAVATDTVKKPPWYSRAS